MANDVALAFQAFGVGLGVLGFLGLACLIELRIRTARSSARRDRSGLSLR